MTNLLIYPAVFGEPSASAFCVKVMCMLKAADIHHTVEETADPRKAPKGKLPVLQNENLVIADSDAIRDYIEDTYKVDFDQGLSAEQRAVSRSMIRMVEEHIYFALLCDRWANDENWVHVKQAFFSNIPFPLNGFVTRQIRKQALSSLQGQGMGRFDDRERFGRVRKDIEAIVDFLGDKLFLFGPEPKASDMSVVPMLNAALATPVETDLSDFIRKNTVLRAYLARGREHLYPADI